MKIGYVAEEITVTQKKFTNELIHDTGIENERKVVTPLPINLKLKSDEKDIYMKIQASIDFW